MKILRTRLVVEDDAGTLYEFVEHFPGGLHLAPDDSLDLKWHIGFTGETLTAASPTPTVVSDSRRIVV